MIFEAKSPASSTMQASDAPDQGQSDNAASNTTDGADPRWLTVSLVFASAVFWWAAQPGGLLSVEWNALGTFAQVAWVALLLQAGIGAARGRTVAWWTLISFLAVWLITLSWIRAVSVAGWPALSLYSAAYPTIFVLLVRWVSRHQRMPTAVLAGLIGVSLEYIRTEVLFDAWPFHLIAGHWCDAEVATLVQWGGVWAWCLLLFWTGAFIGMRHRTVWDWLLVLPLALPWLVDVPSAVQRVSDSSPLRVLAVQTNLPQNNKMSWTHEQQANDLQQFRALTLAALDQTGEVDLVVWPETMVPGLGFDPDTMALLDQLGDAVAPWRLGSAVVQQSVLQTGVPWLVGSPTWTGVEIIEDRLEPARRYNSAVLVLPDGSLQRYDKIFLTPFGETMPYARHWKWLEEAVMDFGAAGMRFNLDAGMHPSQLTLTAPGATEAWQVAVPICFEDAVPSVVRRLAVTDGHTMADVLINISNDGWFSDHDSGRRSHEAAAMWRAVELGRPLLRVANTGVTSLILPDGTHVDSLPPRSEGTLVVEIPRFEGTTLYARWGNWLPRSCIIFAFLGLLARWWLGRFRPDSSGHLSSPA
ncbi:MAG: apolipoprotein N-acyltransferase [Phycisphaerales bacterium]|nr:apolipoprotein N-acyltransferase [Phycisphaerales bacterium]